MKFKLFKTVIVFALLSSVLLFSGCGENDLTIQERECLKQDKNFLTKKVLNYRTGEFVFKGECV